MVQRETKKLTFHVETPRRMSLGPRTARGRRASNEEKAKEKLASWGGKMGWPRNKHF